MGRTLLPHELVSELVIPELRGILAHKLGERGLSQIKISRLLGISQPMVSRYASTPLSKLFEKLRELGLDVDEVARIADVLVEKILGGNYQEYLRLLNSYVNTVLRRGLLCDIHRKISPAIPRNCDLCTKLFEEVADSYIEEVKTAYEILSLHPRGYEMVPEVGMNIVSAPPDATDFRDVVGFSGRIVRTYNKVVAAGEPVRGGSRHTANVLLKVMKKFPSVRSAIVIRYSDKCVQKMVSTGMNVAETVPHASEREFFSLLEKTLETLDREPDAIADPGGPGMEPVVYVFSTSAIRAVKKALTCIDS